MILDKYRLDGKVALITGGSRGIGKAIALGFAEAGADLVIASRRLPELEAAANEISALGRRCLPVTAHAAKKEDLDSLVNKTMAEFGQIDILVNNASTNPYYGKTIDAEELVWDTVMNLNLKGYFLLSQKVARIMIHQGGGSIICVSSTNAMRPIQGVGIYAVSKAGEIALVKVLSIELGEYNIRVNAIAPGSTKTRLVEVAMQDPEMKKRIIDHTALGRLAETEDMQGAALFLASDASRHVTGQTIVVDGGPVMYGNHLD